MGGGKGGLGRADPRGGGVGGLRRGRGVWGGERGPGKGGEGPGEGGGHAAKLKAASALTSTSGLTTVPGTARHL